MRILVCVKHVPNIESQRAFASGRVVRGTEDGSLNELDEHPIEEALRILERLEPAEKEASEVVVLTVGPSESVDGVRRAFQLGVDAGIHITDVELSGSDYFGTASTLAGAIRKVDAETPLDLVLMGMAALDGLGSVIPALVAAELGWPQLTNASSLAIDVEGASARIERVVDGITEELSGPLPAVVSVSDQINSPRMPNFKLIMAARTKQITTWSLADIGIAPESVGTSGARVEILAATPRPERAPVELVVDEGSGGLALADFIIRTGLVEGV